MTKEDIITLPNPLLRKTSQRIAVIDNHTIRLANDMKQATLDWENSRDQEVGVAMAAIQVGKPQKLIIVRQEASRRDKSAFLTLINPQIVKKDGKITSEPEGCLSIPDLYGSVPRYNKIKLKATDIEGRNIRLTAEGFLARILQHEIDHLKGKLFVDRVKNKKFYKIERDGKLNPIKGEDLKKQLQNLNLNME